MLSLRPASAQRMILPFLDIQCSPVCDDHRATHLRLVPLDSGLPPQSGHQREVVDIRQGLDLHPLHPVVDTGTKITGKPLDEICHNAKIAVIVLMPTFSTFSTYNCLDAEFLLQFPCRHSSEVSPSSTLPPGNSQNPAKFSPEDRRASKTEPFVRMIAAVTTFSQLMLER
jgi:hypothetical protein